MKRGLLLFSAVLLLTGCGSSKNTAVEEAPVDSDTRFQQSEKLKKSADNFSSLAERMVISNASLRIKTAEEDATHQAMIDMASKYGGYVLRSEARMTSIRIPATGFREAIAEIELLGELLSRTITGQDVTESYDDLQTRLDNAEQTRLRYFALLDRAINIEEILQLERELERLSGEIEMLKGKLARMGHLVKYATIAVFTVPIEPETRPGPLTYAAQKIYSGVKWLFVWQ